MSKDRFEDCTIMELLKLLADSYNLTQEEKNLIRTALQKKLEIQEKTNN